MKLDLVILDDRLVGWGFPHWGSEHAAGLDLFACLDEPVRLEPRGAACLIPAGFALGIGDADWAAMIYPRSGRGHRDGLVLGNGVGVIDADYEGPILISAWNRGADSAIIVSPGERIAQMVFTRIVRPSVTLVDRLAPRSRRGAGGFGSTGA